MLEYDPEKRISAKQALQHPWIRSSKSGDRNLYIMDEFSLMNKFCAMSNFKQHIATYIIHNLTTAE
jgi:serine/threonine protein kinase